MGHEVNLDVSHEVNNNSKSVTKWVVRWVTKWITIQSESYEVNHEMNCNSMWIKMWAVKWIMIQSESWSNEVSCKMNRDSKWVVRWIWYTIRTWIAHTQTPIIWLTVYFFRMTRFAKNSFYTLCCNFRMSLQSPKLFCSVWNIFFLLLVFFILIAILHSFTCLVDAFHCKINLLRLLFRH